MKPIGIVHNNMGIKDSPFPFYVPAQVVLEPQYAPALKNLQLNSHIWLLCQYTHRRAPKLVVHPTQIDPQIEKFGVLAIRSPNHPNPIALTLVRLLEVEDHILHVENCDAYDGTPVLDIKPYFDRDIVFSPRLPDIRHRNEVQRLRHLRTVALNHHQEECLGAALAVKMVIQLEDVYGLNPGDPALTLTVSGAACLADTLQGITRARLANPPRFSYRQTAGASSCLWRKGARSIELAVRETAWQQPVEELWQMPGAELFTEME